MQFKILFFHLRQKMKKIEDVKVLFVDDDEEIGYCFKRLYESKYGENKVSLATSAQGALNILEHNDFDLIVTDIVMPEMDGIELTEVVVDVYNLPVVLITGFAPKDVLPLGFSSDKAVCCIHKPCTFSAMKDKIQEALDIYNKRINSHEE